jgi:hypothetical protein
MPELVAAHGGNLRDAFPKSAALLNRTVAMPLGVAMASDAPERARSAIKGSL